MIPEEGSNPMTASQMIEAGTYLQTWRNWPPDDQHHRAAMNELEVLLRRSAAARAIYVGAQRKRPDAGATVHPDTVLLNFLVKHYEPQLFAMLWADGVRLPLHSIREAIKAAKAQRESETSNRNEQEKP